MNVQELESLGLTKEDVLASLTEKLCSSFIDPEGRGMDLEGKINESIKKHIDTVLAKAIDEQVKPMIAGMTENLVLQKTTAWGEKKGAPVSFIEYLIERADSYMRDRVNYKGESKTEQSYGTFEAKTTRIGHMIHEHLYYSIERAMKQALSTADASVRKSLEEAVKISLSNIIVKVKTDIKT